MISVLPTPAWLRHFTKVTAALTLFLIFAGAMVTSTGSGLAVPDWPLSYGMLLPPMVGGILYETGHRLIAGSVGFLILIQAFALQFFEPKKFVRKLGWASLGCVILQGVLGGLTVLFLQPHALSVAHGAVAELLLCLNVTIAFSTSSSSLPLAPQRGERGAGVRGFTALPIIVYVQILLGAVMRHMNAGVVFPDFPLSNGKLIPDFTSAAIAANYAHRLGALAVTFAILSVALHCFRTKQFRGYAIGLLTLLGFQIYFGIKVVFDYAGNQALYHSLVGQPALHHASITSMHVVTGASILATSLLLALKARTTSSQLVELTPQIAEDLAA
ncbi:MAG TPA: COX15/CtaA family protein [Thermoanaerobaculia bacterium]